MGIPGLILAPVVLNYLRVEMLTVEVPPLAEAPNADLQAPKKFEISKLRACWFTECQALELAAFRS